MHVAYVLKKFPRLSETFILNEILELQRQGVQVTVISLHRPDDGRFHAKLAELQSDVIYLPGRVGPELLATLRRDLNWLRPAGPILLDELDVNLSENREDTWSVLRWGMEVASLLRSRGVTRMHAHFATVAVRVARLAHRITGVPFSFTCHAKDLYRNTVDKVAFQRMVEHADFAVTVCEANRRFIDQELLQGRFTGKVATLYNGVDLRAFAVPRQPATPPLVLGVGRLVEKKGFRYLIDAVAGLVRDGKALDLAIVGDGEDRKQLEAHLASVACPRIRMLGARTQDQVRQLMGQATLMALPCVVGEDGNRDALPTVLLEAMAAGVPVISTPVGGVEEIVDDGRAGVLVPEHDVPALQRAIVDLLDQPAKARELGEHGRVRAERLFDLTRNVATLRGWFTAGKANVEVRA
jgi:colanic acid/amylovoran biosynthesis glycosyltransferase